MAIIRQIEIHKIDSKAFERGLKVVLGIIVSILIAEKAGLKFAASTGIVAMLGIQNTRKETISTAVRRVISFGYTILTSYAIHTYIGGSTVDFTLVIFVITMITFSLEWQETLSVNIVVAVHLFLQHQMFTTLLLTNEAERVMIGMLTAIVVNWHHPTSEEEFETMIGDMELQLQQLLTSLASFFLGQTELQESYSKMKVYGKTVEEMLGRAYTYSNNHMSRHAIFYEHYMCMREQEYAMLEEILSQTKTFHQLPASAVLLGDYIKEVSEAVSVQNPADSGMGSFTRLQQKLQQEEMPTNYEELEDRATVLSVVKEMMEMIQLKHEFVDSLSGEQRQHYLAEAGEHE